VFRPRTRGCAAQTHDRQHHDHAMVASLKSTTIPPSNRRGILEFALVSAVEPADGALERVAVSCPPTSETPVVA
jgi:hypothetical protein